MDWIFLSIQIVCLGAVATRFYRPSWVRNISFFKLVAIVIGLNLLYAVCITLGQYYVWSVSSDVSKIIVQMPLSKEALFPVYLEWIRPLFEHRGGYFMYYVLGRVWLEMLLLHVVAGMAYGFFRLWQSHRGGFSEGGSEVLLLTMLVSGWPGILVTLCLGLVLSVPSFFISYARGNSRVRLEPVFISAAVCTLVIRIIVGVIY